MAVPFRASAIWVLLVGVALLIAAGCGGGDDTPASGDAPAEVAPEPEPEPEPVPAGDVPEPTPSTPPPVSADEGEDLPLDEYIREADVICGETDRAFEVFWESTDGLEELTATVTDVGARLRALGVPPGDTELALRVYGLMELQLQAFREFRRASEETEALAALEDFDRFEQEAVEKALAYGFSVCGPIQATAQDVASVDEEVLAGWIEEGDLIANAEALAKSDPALRAMDREEIAELVNEGASAFADDDLGCLWCHTYRGAGTRNLGAPSLGGAGLLGRGVDWQIAHLEAPADLVPGSLMPSFRLLSEEQLLALAVFLEASRLPEEAPDTDSADPLPPDGELSPAPAEPPPSTPLTGAQQFISLGCGACHTLEAARTVGEIGPDLDQTQPSLELAIERITNGDPSGLMPAYGGAPIRGGVLTEEEIHKIATFVTESTNQP